MLLGVIFTFDGTFELRVLDHKSVILNLLFLLVLLVNIGCNSKHLSEEKASSKQQLRGYLIENCSLKDLLWA